MEFVPKNTNVQKDALSIRTNDDHQNPNKLLVFSTCPSSVSNHIKFCTIDCEPSENGFTPFRPFPFNISHYISIITSFHELVCIGYTDWKRYSDLLLWNPLTGEYKTLSKTNSHKTCYQHNRQPIFELYYSSSDDDYKLLRVTEYQDAYIYSLKSDSWRKVDTTATVISYHLQGWKACCWLNEKLYFLNGKKSVVIFDTKMEKFTEIAVPSFFDILSFTVLKGFIHLCVVTFRVSKADSTIPSNCIELWRMNGDHGDLTKVAIYWKTPYNEQSTSPLHIMQNGIWLMHSGIAPSRYIFKVDMEKYSKEISYSYKAHNVWFPSKGKFIETLVSPNQYVKFILP